MREAAAAHPPPVEPRLLLVCGSAAATLLPALVAAAHTLPPPVAGDSDAPDWVPWVTADVGIGDAVTRVICVHAPDAAAARAAGAALRACGAGTAGARALLAIAGADEVQSAACALVAMLAAVGAPWAGATQLVAAVVVAANADSAVDATRTALSAFARGGAPAPLVMACAPGTLCPPALVAASFEAHVTSGTAVAALTPAAQPPAPSAEASLLRALGLAATPVHGASAPPLAAFFAGLEARQAAGADAGARRRASDAGAATVPGGTTPLRPPARARTASVDTPPAPRAAGGGGGVSDSPGDGGGSGSGGSVAGRPPTGRRVSVGPRDRAVAAGASTSSRVSVGPRDVTRPAVVAMTSEVAPTPAPAPAPAAAPALPAAPRPPRPADAKSFFAGLARPRAAAAGGDGARQ